MFLLISSGGLWVTLCRIQNKHDESTVFVLRYAVMQLNGRESEVRSKDRIDCQVKLVMSQSTRPDTMACSGCGRKVTCYLRQLQHSRIHFKR